MLLLHSPIGHPAAFFHLAIIHPLQNDEVKEGSEMAGVCQESYSSTMRQQVWWCHRIPKPHTGHYIVLIGEDQEPVAL